MNTTAGSRADAAAAVACDVVGRGRDALLLPALSSIATRQEMRPLAERLAGGLHCVLPDWPGFGGAAPRGQPLSPAAMDAFLDAFLDAGFGTLVGRDAVGIAAGHGATYLIQAALRHPGAFSRLVLIAPTWRGPLPTVTDGRKPALCRRVRTAIEMPGIGPLLYRLNLSRPIVARMMREHVYADPAKVTPALLRAKLAVAGTPGRRFGTAAFVTGGLDPVGSRSAFLALFEGDLPPILMLRPRGTPARSAAEMDALAATGRVEAVTIGGALAAHEEVPDEVAAAIEAWLAILPKLPRTDAAQRA